MGNPSRASGYQDLRVSDPIAAPPPPHHHPPSIESPIPALPWAQCQRNGKGNILHEGSRRGGGGEREKQKREGSSEPP